jgi:plasmid replication initiation protein
MYLLDLIKQGEYTQYDLFNILGLKSKYSIRLYELLKSYAYKGSKTYEIDELRTILAAENYKNFYNFRERVLKKSVKEINKYTDLDIDFSLYDRNGIKVNGESAGKKICSVKFKIQKKTIENSYTIYRKIISDINKRNRQIKGQLEFDESMNLYEI